jgi:hypothetical protein
MCYIRRALIIGLIAAADIFMLWTVFASRVTLHQALGWVALFVFAAAPLGGYWTVYDCFRYEKHFWRRMVWVAIPYFFVWHYFERVQRRSTDVRNPVRSVRAPLSGRTADSGAFARSASWPRRLAWLMLFLATTGFALWYQLGPWWPKPGVESAFVTLFFTAHPLGALWMLYRSVRFERHPVPFVLLAFVPYAFIWYYFERVRKIGWNQVGSGTPSQTAAGR